MTIQERVNKVYPTRIVRRIKKTDQIDAARVIFQDCWFDRAKCAEGLKALGHWKYEIVSEDGQLSKEPVHDWSSHGSDAFLGSAVAVKEPRSERLAAQREAMERIIPRKKALNIADFSSHSGQNNQSLGWMA